jgi:hypothetical protein
MIDEFFLKHTPLGWHRASAGFPLRYLCVLAHRHDTTGTDDEKGIKNKK